MTISLQDQLNTKVKSGKKLFVPYLTAGMPSPQSFVDLFAELSRYSDAIEVGIPFSDPIMDGPIIQQSSVKALEAGVTVNHCFDLIAQCLQHSACPAVAMSYFNPIHKMGPAKFAARLADSGAGGLIVPDLPYEEATEFTKQLQSKGLAHIQMIAPATSADRAAMLAAGSTGWVYAVSRMGVTGEQQALAQAASEVVERIKPHANVPVLLGIGISNGEQAAQACSYSDGVIVGSALVKLVLAGDLEGAVNLGRDIRRSIDEAALNLA